MNFVLRGGLLFCEHEDIANIRWTCTTSTRKNARLRHFMILLLGRTMFSLLEAAVYRKMCLYTSIASLF